MEDSRIDVAPSEHAHPLMVLTPIGETRSVRAVRPGVDWPVVVAGIAVLVATAELGRRAGASARMTALYSTGGCAVVIVVPHLVSAVPRPRFRHPSAIAAR
ncbi:hypothetical protein ACH35V_11875 [Actinomadura sp. 1N219]|uniref:hypothetical protein n=1 Tax=Actinomadura sp. 1N219 TaxID=3375152 RepID=UPI0037B8E0D6